MKNLLKKATAILATTVMVASIGMPAFAATDAETAQQATPRATTTFYDNGGSGTWGYGSFNAWCKYRHAIDSTCNKYAASLTIDGTSHVGGWETDGVQDSYVSNSVGRFMQPGGLIQL